MREERQVAWLESPNGLGAIARISITGINVKPQFLLSFALPSIANLGQSQQQKNGTPFAFPGLNSTGSSELAFRHRAEQSISWIAISQGLREHIGKLLLAGVGNQDLAKGESQVCNQPASTSFSNAAWINSRMIRVAPAMRCARSLALLMVGAGVFYPISSVRLDVDKLV